MIMGIEVYLLLEWLITDHYQISSVHNSKTQTSSDMTNPTGALARLHSKCGSTGLFGRVTCSFTWCKGSCCSEEPNTTSLDSFFFFLMSEFLWLDRMENPKRVVWWVGLNQPLCQCTKIIYIHVLQKRNAKAKSNNPRDWNPVTWWTAKTSKLLWSGVIWQKKRGGKSSIPGYIHTRLVHGEQTRAERLSRLKSSPQKHSVTHTPCCSTCWQSQHCLRDTHSCCYELAAAGHPSSPRRRIIHRSCLRIGRSGWMPASSVTFLLLILACISEVQTQMFWCLACVLKFGHLTVIHGRADEILLGWYRDQSCHSILWWESVTQSKHKCLMSDGFITDNLIKDKKNLIILK